MTPRLILNRMAVFRKGHSLYDQRFHAGVNIIHGDNGSGKSTLADFIFFGLGGDLKEWKAHAELAEFVVLEIEAGDALLTLRREVSQDGGRPMQIFFGSADAALLAGPNSWESLPYKRPEAGYSFNQVLFRAIGIPEAVSDGSSSITMHQLLRLLYTDQMTPVQRIFRVEPFDPWQTRQAVGELLCGIGGYELYSLQIEVRELEKEYDAVSTQLRNLMTVATSYGDRILIENIEAAAANVSSDRDRLLQQLSGLLGTQELSQSDLEDVAKLRKEAIRELAQARKTVIELQDKIETLEYEIDDAGLFIAHLEQSLADFDDAAATFVSLGHVRFEFCPSCFTPTSSTLAVLIHGKVDEGWRV